MKFFLIFIAMNMTNPTDPSILGHKLLDSKAECETVGKKMVADNPAPGNVRMATFCISEQDMLEIKSLT